MKEGTSLLISPREVAKEGDNSLQKVWVLDTINDVRKVKDLESRTFENLVVTRYLVHDEEGNIFTIFHNQIRKLVKLPKTSSTSVNP